LGEFSEELDHGNCLVTPNRNGRKPQKTALIKEGIKKKAVNFYGDRQPKLMNLTQPNPQRADGQGESVK